MADEDVTKTGEAVANVELPGNIQSNEVQCICEEQKEPKQVENGELSSFSLTDKDGAILSDSYSSEPSSEDKKKPEAVSVIQAKSEKPYSRKDHGKGRHKEDRSIDHVLRALHGLKTPEERLAALCKKYADLLEEHRNSQLSVKQNERRVIQLIKEKEQLQTDNSKSVLARSRLEGLCRELQRQCKTVKEESILRVREEEEKRKEVSAKFQTTLTEISNLMQENNQKNSVLREENLELSQKLKSLVEQYELREQHIDKVLKHKELELQLSEAKLAKSNMVIAEDKEKYLREKHKLLEDLTEYQRRCTELATNEVQLRNQLSMYTDKYTEFQDTLTKSNQVFMSFKTEMEKMSKKIKKLEKETGSWKSRWESSNRALLEMAEDKQRRDLELFNSGKKVAQLEKLCRALQTECTTLRNQVKNSRSIDFDSAHGSTSNETSLENDPTVVNGSTAVSVTGAIQESQATFSSQTVPITDLETVISAPILNANVESLTA